MTRLAGPQYLAVMCIPAALLDWARVASDALIVIAVGLGLRALWKGLPEGRAIEVRVTENMNGQPSPPPKIRVRLRTALWWSLAGVLLLLLVDLATALATCD